MFSNMSWGEYFTATVIILAIYYLSVSILFYHREIVGLLRGKGQAVLKHAVNKQEENIDELERTVHDINGILEKAGKETGKSELLTQLKERLASFAGLRQPAYRVAITNYIIRYTKTFCGVAFSEDELEEEWKTLLR